MSDRAKHVCSLDAVSRVDTAMRVDLIEPTDRRWRDTLATIRHDFYHLPGYVSLESSRLGGTAMAAYVEQPGVRLLLPVIRRAIPGSDAFDLVSPYGYPSPIAQFEDVALLRGAFSAVVQTLRERGFVSMFVRLHPILELPDGALTDLGTLVEHGRPCRSTYARTKRNNGGAFVRAIGHSSIGVSDSDTGPSWTTPADTSIGSSLSTSRPCGAKRRF